MPPLNEPKHESFARLVASGKSKRDAAIEVGYEPKYASNHGYRLAKNDEIGRRIDELQSKVAENVVSKTTQFIDIGIASRQSRLDALNRRWQLLEQIRQERAADPTMQAVPGGKTGYIIRRFKSIGTGPNAKTIPEYETDHALLKEIRAHEQQAAIESGQWQKNEEERPVVDVIAYKWIDEEEKPEEQRALTSGELADLARVQ